MKHSDITEKIIQAFYEVYNVLGHGFLEQSYQNALFIELKEMGLEVITQVEIPVFYKGRKVGHYKADMIVEGKVILELKATKYLELEYQRQLLNYLKATEIEVGLLLGFGLKAEFKRKVWTNIYDEIDEVDH